MKALSIRPPWSTLIVIGIKSIENRTWYSGYRGPLLIHSSKTWDEEGAKWIISKDSNLNGLIRHSNHLKGQIIGKVDMVDCVQEHISDWFCGPFGFVFKNAAEFHRKDAVTYRGKLNFFDVPYSLVKKAILRG